VSALNPQRLDKEEEDKMGCGLEQLVFIVKKRQIDSSVCEYISTIFS
jgi:hypothetical protein